jgi:hypothetical protein
MISKGRYSLEVKEEQSTGDLQQGSRTAFFVLVKQILQLVRSFSFSCTWKSSYIRQRRFWVYNTINNDMTQMLRYSTVIYSDSTFIYSSQRSTVYKARSNELMQKPKPCFSEAAFAALETQH